MDKVIEEFLDSLWHVWPEETPPKEKGIANIPILARRICSLTGKLEYRLVSWWWYERPDLSIKGFHKDGNVFIDFEDSERFEWMYVRDLE